MIGPNLPRVGRLRSSGGTTAVGTGARPPCAFNIPPITTFPPPSIHTQLWLGPKRKELVPSPGGEATSGEIRKIVVDDKQLSDGGIWFGLQLGSRVWRITGRFGLVALPWFPSFSFLLLFFIPVQRYIMAFPAALIGAQCSWAVML